MDKPESRVSREIFVKVKRYLLLLASLCVNLAVKAKLTDRKDVKEEASAGIVRVYVVHETREHWKPYRRGDLQHRLSSGFFS